MNGGGPPAARRTLLTPSVWLVLFTLAGWLLLTWDGLAFAYFGLRLPDAWFLDSHAVLAAGDAVTAGLDPAAANPLDALRRWHSYSDWWLGLRHLGLTREDNFLVGGSWVLAFFGLAVAVLRPAGRRAAGGAALLLCAPPVLLAVQRANNDLVVFALLAGAGLCWRPGSAWRQGLAWGLLALATGLKYYPVVAAGLWLLMPANRRSGGAAALAAGGLAAVLASVAGTMERGAFGLPIDVHKTGLPILLHDLGVNLAPVRLLAVLALGVGGWWLARRGWTTGLAAPEGGRARALFVIGALVTVACFVAGVSHAYRAVFLLLLLPWLWAGAGGPSRGGWLATALIAVVLWGDGLFCLGFNLSVMPAPETSVRAGLLGWRLVSQPWHWLLVLLLAGWLADLALTRWREYRAIWIWPRWLGPRVWFAGLSLGLLAGLTVPAKSRRTLGIADYGKQFLDSYAVLATLDAHRAGISPDAPNPYDPLQRNHKYSDWWLGLTKLGLTRADNVWVGGLWVVAFLLAVFLTVKPQGHAEATWLALLLASPPVVLGLERANNDLVIFVVLAPVAVALLRPGGAAAAVVVAGIAAATGLKFYPAAAAAAVMVVRPPRRALGLGLALAGGLGLVFWSVGAQMTRGTFDVEAGVHVVGARLWPADLGVPAAAASWAAAAAVAVGAWLLALGGLKAPGREPSAGPFVLAAAVLVACYVAGLSYSYRLIFTLWLAPWLWQAPGPAARAARWLLPVVLWADGLLCAVINLGLLGPLAVDFERLQRSWRLVTQPVHWALLLLLAGWLVAGLLAFGREWRAGQSRG